MDPAIGKLWLGHALNMHETGRAFFEVFRKCDPALDAEQRPACRLALRTLTFRMNDASSGGHPVQRSGSDCLLGSKAVPVVQFAVEQIGHRRKADMGMRLDVDAAADKQFGRPHLVEEDEGTDHAAANRGKGAAHLKSPDVAGARNDDRLDRVATCRIARKRIRSLKPAHVSRPSSPRSIC